MKPNHDAEKTKNAKNAITENKGKQSERKEEKRLRAYFVRLFGKYDIRNETQFVIFGKWLIFIVLILVETLIFMQHLDDYFQPKGWKIFIAILTVSTLLTLSEGLKSFVITKGKIRALFYTIDALAACCFMFVTGGVLPVVIYMLVLTEFYIGVDDTQPRVVMLCFSACIYIASYFIKALVPVADERLTQVFMQSLGGCIALGVHFVVVNVALAFYRQFLRLDKALTELDERKRELEKAYEVVAEVTALEERQRIAKEIHDTAGHSLTTVIMQTESAKRILEQNPEEAKSKIVAANLQAKHALEELRDSVHLLSGIGENATLKDALVGIIHESTDGTGIVIRSEIADVNVSSAKYRFLCNTLKEGISNGLRHGGATAFWFELREENNRLSFLLSDNGAGVDMQKLQTGFGLTTMQQRVISLGGEVSFDSEQGEGFEIRLFLPTDKAQ